MQKLAVRGLMAAAFAVGVALPRSVMAHGDELGLHGDHDEHSSDDHDHHEHHAVD